MGVVQSEHIPTFHGTPWEISFGVSNTDFCSPFHPSQEGSHQGLTGSGGSQGGATAPGDFAPESPSALVLCVPIRLPIAHFSLGK